MLPRRNFRALQPRAFRLVPRIDSQINPIMTIETIERRGEHRVQLDIPAKIRWKDSLGGIIERDARLWNLSGGGAYVLTDDLLILEQNVELIVILESNDPYKGVATYFRAPAKTPKEVVDRLNREFVAAMKRPEVIAAMDKQAFAMTPSTPEQLGEFVKSQKEAYARILRAAGVQPE